ncbi:ATP-grasp domain-containing protein [Cohnella ginsengisoli]|uniref:ATP-grasp domain-containing protein n=1 Tax=Cohnella ginsengisoli TaxID=425004 RepID=A0A9X4QR82_9BACL|nr:NAD-dependent epimerase/dehydratase family protein [Cohnella ginsengisoli]MDG0794585.1 ATP-grasp domain-containing protein [Cohnella ginsengisoli]
MYKDKRIFVSGGAGVIGTSLVRRLVAAGATVWVGDLKPRPSWLPASVLYRQGDLNELTRAEIEAFSPNAFFHLAATFERSTESYEFWEENDRHNVRLSHHLIHLMKDLPSLERVVFASSYLIYDPDMYQFEVPAAVPTALREIDRMSPRNLCGMAKLMHEKELAFIQRFSQERLKTVSARIYRVYGKNSRDIVSRWVKALLRGETIQVYRKEGMFDYIYADDVAEGLYRLALSEATGVVNLGNGRARRVDELVQALATHFPDMHAIEGESDIPYEASEADMSLFERWTGWRPQRQLEDVLPELVDHYRNAANADRQEQNTSLCAGRSVLISSVSRKISLIRGVRTALDRIEGQRGWAVIGGDVDGDCLGSRFTDAFWRMPRLDNLSLTELIEGCFERGVSRIIPTRDGELSYYAGHSQALRAAGIEVMVSNPETVRVCLDKLAFAEAGARLGFPVIPAAAKLDEGENNRYVVKERYGAGSRSVGLGLDRGSAQRHAMALEHPIFQPFIEGPEISVDVYVTRAGRCKGVVLRRRRVVVNGESQVTESFRDEGLETLFASFAERLGLYGHAVFQAIRTGPGECRIIECNSRWGGASRLSCELGLDSLYWFLLEASGADLDDFPYMRAATDKTLIRYPEDLIQ